MGKFLNVFYGSIIILRRFLLCFKFSSLAKINIGPNVMFNSKNIYNMVGINKKCTVYVGNRARLSLGDFSGFSWVSIYCSLDVLIGGM